jgi:hypothetical protein
LKTLIKISIFVILQIICFQPDTFAQDTVYFEKPARQKFSPDPVKATMLAVALPGMGQVYNRKYWKVPVVYVTLTGLLYAVGRNSSNYTTYMKAYQDFTDRIPQTNSYIKIGGLEDVDPIYDEINNPEIYLNYKEQMVRLIDYYKKNRDLSYIGIGLWYIASIIDANVDASLFNYDVSDNLDVAVMPIQTPLPGGYMGAGVNVSFMFNF